MGQNSLGAWEGQVNESALNSWENHCNYRCRVPPLPPGKCSLVGMRHPLSAQPRTLIGSCVLREQRLSLAREKGSAELGQAPLWNSDWEWAAPECLL